MQFPIVKQLAVLKLRQGPSIIYNQYKRYGVFWPLAATYSALRFFCFLLLQLNIFEQEVSYEKSECDVPGSIFRIHCGR